MAQGKQIGAFSLKLTSQTFTPGPDNTLTGGHGPDTFIFQGTFGRNEVVDFDPRADVIQLSKSDFTGFNTVIATASYDAASWGYDDHGPYARQHCSRPCETHGPACRCRPAHGMSHSLSAMSQKLRAG